MSFLKAISANAILIISCSGQTLSVRSFHIGNSLTAQTLDHLGFSINNLTAARSIDATWARHIKCGSQLNDIVANPTTTCLSPAAPYGYFGTALPGYDWDQVTLQMYGDPMPAGRAAANSLIDLTRERPANASTEFLLMSMWPQNESTDSYASRWNRAYDEGVDDYESRWSKQYAVSMLQHLRNDQPGVNIGMVLSGEVLYQFDLLAQAGQVANYTSASQLYADALHLGTSGAYLSRMTLFATMYHTSPAALPVPSNVDFAPQDILKLQQLVWDTVTENSALSLVIASDANRDGRVNTVDFNALAGKFGTSTYLAREGDFDGSGVVNSFDFNLLASQFGQTVAAGPLLGTAVPEPSGITALVLASGLLLRRRV